MAVRVAINGFGRIGRLVLRALIESGRRDIDVVGINDLGSVETNAHLLKYDTAHGTLPQNIRAVGDNIEIGRKKIPFTSISDPAKLPYKKLKVDIALECTGKFTKRPDAEKLLKAGAKKVLISAPGTDADITVVYGVNTDLLKKSHKIISNASCTTNCLAPVAQVLDQLCGIEKGFMTTVHAYTGDQPTLDTQHRDLRRARAAASSMIPTTTGAARAVGLVLPQLDGKLDGTSIRVPTNNVSLIDLTFESSKPVTAEAINRAMKKAAKGPFKGILGVNEAPLVSIDFNHNPNSSTFDATQTQVIGGNLVRVLSWYDNEWGFSNRMLDTIIAISKAK